MPRNEPILLRKSNETAIITLNDEATLNALTEEMLASLLDALSSCEEDKSTNAVIITGSGRGFCSGANLKSSIVDKRAGNFAQWIKDNLNPVVERINSSRLPIIAAVNGPAAGAGVSLALGCDLILGAESAKFVVGFARIGVGMDLGASWTLPRIIGMNRTKQLAMLGRSLDAETARQWGLIVDVYPASELMHQAEILCADLLANSTPPAIASIKDQLNHAAISGLKESLDFEAEVQAKLVLTHESKGLIDSFGR